MKIQRAEIWLVKLDPTVGAEIRKTRPVVVVSSDAVGTLPIRLVSPLTEWKDRFAGNLWHVKLLPDLVNGLAKELAVDALQLRGLDESRFVQKLGRVTSVVMRSILDAISVVIEEDKGGLVTVLPITTATEREWNFRDDNNQEFHGDIPVGQRLISITLNWKPDSATTPKLVGKYRVDLGLLLAEGYVQEVRKGIYLRFQRTGEMMEIAVNRDSPALVVGRRPQ